MKAVAVLLVLAAARATADTNPVAKVISMLSGLEAKIIKEGEESQRVYTEYTEWCEDRSKNVGYEIKTGKAEVEQLKATIESAAASIDELNGKIDELASSLAKDESDLKAATAIRAKESQDFAASETELLDVVDTLERAIGILEREAAKGSAAMVQIKKAQNVAQAISVMVDAAMLKTQDATRLQSLVQRSANAEDADDADMGVGAPDAATYKSHSGSLIETLEGLLDKAKDELEDARRTETNSLHNFQMLKQSLEDEIKFSTKDMGEAKKGLAGSTETKATAEGDLTVTTKALKEDEATLKDLHGNCMQAAEDFEAEVKSRAEELKALAEAKKIITEATDGATEVEYGASFLQWSQWGRGQSSGRLTTGVDLANFEAVRFVRNLARKHHDPALAQLASRMAMAVRYGAAAGDDPFAKVKSLIKDMIEQLLKTQQAEASHKAYCDKELGETAEKKADLDSAIAKLSAKIDTMNSRSAQLKDEVGDLQRELAQLAKSQAEMDKMRQEEHDLFANNKGELEEGLTGIKAALKILREYYAREDTAHTTASGAGGGIIGMLEVVESDFSKSLAEMSADEFTAQAAYEKETRENEISRTMKEQDVKYKTKEFKGLDTSVAEAGSDLQGAQTELAAVMQYKGKLIEMCVAKPETYGERKARREAEIAGLKEALQILQGEAVLLQKGARQPGLRGGMRRA